MKFDVKFEKQKGMKEADVRESIARAAARARDVAAQQGKGDVSQESLRREMEKYAEKDRREGRI
jgi:hypothetical protein